MTQFGYHFLQEGFSDPQAWPSTTLSVFIAFSFAVVRHSITSDSLWPHELQHARLLYPLLPPGVCWNSYPLNQWCHPMPYPLLPPPPAALSLTQHQSLFQWVSSLHQVAKVWELQHQSFQLFRVYFLQDSLVWSPCCPRDPQDSSPALQFKSINSFERRHTAIFMVQLSNLTWLLEKPLLWLYGPLSTKWCVCFLIRCLGLSGLFFQGASFFEFMNAVTLCCDGWSPRK